MDSAPEALLPRIAAAYFPPASGRYEVKPGLLPLGTDLGNGPADALLFQFDAGFAAYRTVKMQARAERLGKYYRTRDLSPEVTGAVCGFIARRLAGEHPRLFSLEERGAAMHLHSHLHGVSLQCDRAGQRLLANAADPPYADPLDALATLVQEDLAVVCRRQGRDWAAAIHLCFPYRWTAEQKIGQDFVTMHLPVPGMESFRRPGMVTNMIAHGPFVRFVWELVTDDRLNHHPEPPPGTDACAWRPQPFDPRHPRLFLRVEREVIWGFPEQEASLFSIRVSFRSGEEIRRDAALRGALCAAIESMSQEALRYKGLTESRDQILDWLQSGGIETGGTSH